MFLTTFEVIIVVLFGLALLDAFNHYKTNRLKLFVLLSSFVYMLIFENLNMLIAAAKEGSYYYNPGFLLFAGYVPTTIVMLWAVLIYTAMHLTDGLNVTRYRKPFIDALIVLLVNLTFQVVLAKQGIVNWSGIASGQGWFGIPVDYMISILLMTFMFSFLFRYFTSAHNEVVNDTSRATFYFLLPVFAYLTSLFAFSAINLTEDALALSNAEELFILWMLVILFALMLKHEPHPERMFKSDNQTTFLMIFTRIAIFSYVMWSVSLMKMYADPLIIIILVISLAAEILLYVSVFKYKEPATEFDHY